VELSSTSEEPANVLAKLKHTLPDNKKANGREYLSVFGYAFMAIATGAEFTSYDGQNDPRSTAAMM
jgi:hypothetical protein